MKYIRQKSYPPALFPSSGNPISHEDDYRLEVLIAVRRIERLDKEEYTDDERQEAQEIYEQRRQEDIAAQEVRHG